MCVTYSSLSTHGFSINFHSSALYNCCLVIGINYSNHRSNSLQMSFAINTLIPYDKHMQDLPRYPNWSIAQRGFRGKTPADRYAFCTAWGSCSN